MKLDKIVYTESYSNRVLFLYRPPIHDYTFTRTIIDYSFLLNRRLKKPFFTCAGSVLSSVAALETY